MINYLFDVVKESLFVKKGGLTFLDKEDARDFQAREEVKLLGGRLPKHVDLMNTYTYDQGRTMHCTAYATAMMSTIMAVAKERDFSIYFNPEQQWKNQLDDPGTASEKSGDYLESALKALKKQPLVYRDRIFSIESYSYANKADWKKYLAKGHPILVGAMCLTPMVDSKYIWKPVEKNSNKGYGHAFAIVGYDDNKECFICQNSYGKWGEKRSGRFYVRYEDAIHLFRGWILKPSF